MEHRFDQAWAPKRCMVCDLEVLDGPYPSQCPGPTAQRFIRELLAQRPTLVQIDEDLWVNPAHVAFVVAADKVSTVSFSSGTHQVVLKPLSEVIALINGSAE